MGGGDRKVIGTAERRESGDSDDDAEGGAARGTARSGTGVREMLDGSFTREIGSSGSKGGCAKRGEWEDKAEGSGVGWRRYEKGKRLQNGEQKRRLRLGLGETLAALRLR